MIANETNIDLYLFIGIAGLLFLILILVGLISYIKDFFHELKEINRRIIQAHGSERKSLIRKRRQLWLSLLPFVKY